MSQDLDRIAEILGDITEQAGSAAREATRESARLEVRIGAVEERIERLEQAINGEGAGRPGLETRVTVIEDWRKTERKRAVATPAAPPPVPSTDSALVAIETKRAEVAKAEAEARKGAWDAVKTVAAKVGPWLVALTALAAQVIQWLAKSEGK